MTDSVFESVVVFTLFRRGSLIANLANASALFGGYAERIE